MARTYTGPASKDTVKGGKKFPLKKVGSDLYKFTFPPAE